MKNRTTLDFDVLKREQALAALIGKLVGGIPHDLPTSRMEQLNRRTEELLHKPLAKLLYGDTPCVLQYLDTVAISSAPKMSLKPFIVKTVKTQPVKWCGISFWTNHNFRMICSQNPNEAKTGQMNARVCQLTEQANFQTIFAEVLGCDPLANWDRWIAQSVPIPAIIAEIEAAEKTLKTGDEPRLLINGFPNFFLVPYRINGQPAVVNCIRRSDGWYVYAAPVSYSSLWYADNRVFSRDS